MARSKSKGRGRPSKNKKAVKKSGSKKAVKKSGSKKSVKKSGSKKSVKKSGSKKAVRKSNSKRSQNDPWYKFWGGAPPTLQRTTGQMYNEGNLKGQVTSRARRNALNKALKQPSRPSTYVNNRIVPNKPISPEGQEVWKTMVGLKKGEQAKMGNTRPEYPNVRNQTPNNIRNMATNYRERLGERKPGAQNLPRRNNGFLTKMRTWLNS